MNNVLLVFGKIQETINNVVSGHLFYCPIQSLYPVKNSAVNRQFWGVFSPFLPKNALLRPKPRQSSFAEIQIGDDRMSQGLNTYRDPGSISNL
jgi:hypothetical protein